MPSSSDAPAASATLVKLQILAYSDEGFSKPVGEAYNVSVNPDKYTFAFQTVYNKEQAPGTAGTDSKFDKQTPATMSFSLVFDATGAIPNSTDVSKDIGNFTSLAYTYNGAIHSPNFLKVIWGSVLFKCRLTSLSIEYTLFNSQGVPLRAKASVSFEGYVDANTLAKQQSNSSPDMTHTRQVVAGDTLPLLCHEIYGDSRYYIDVAKANSLTNFRYLEPGTWLHFPPIQ